MAPAGAVRSEAEERWYRGTTVRRPDRVHAVIIAYDAGLVRPADRPAD